MNNGTSHLFLSVIIAAISQVSVFPFLLAPTCEMTCSENSVRISGRDVRNFYNHYYQMACSNSQQTGL